VVRAVKINGACGCSVLFDKFQAHSTPCATCVPQDICEQCHWPASLGGAVGLRSLTRVKNTRREVDLLIKTGGGNTGINKGIHWHMNTANKVFYVARTKNQVIPGSRP
jgi:hypothetical protein